MSVSTINKYTSCYELLLVVSRDMASLGESVEIHITEISNMNSSEVARCVGNPADSQALLEGINLS